MNELIAKVEQWFIDRGLDKADPTKQMLKLFEEIGEISSGMARSNQEEIKDGIGDVTVVLIGICLQMGLSIEECLDHAYNVIKDRKGKLIDGVWVKQEDLQFKKKLGQRYRLIKDCYDLKAGNIVTLDRIDNDNVGLYKDEWGVKIFLNDVDHPDSQVEYVDEGEHV